MLETPHVVVGAAIAMKVGNPLLAFPLALMSHFVLEKVPHWNPHLNTETDKYGAPTKKSTTIVVIDSTLALVTGTLLSLRVFPDTALALTVFFSCFFSVLPDVVEAPYFFLKIRSEKIKKWIKFQKSLQTDTSPLPGLATQLLTIVASLFWVFS